MCTLKSLAHRILHINMNLKCLHLICCYIVVRHFLAYDLQVFKICSTHEGRATHEMNHVQRARMSDTAL